MGIGMNKTALVYFFLTILVMMVQVQATPYYTNLKIYRDGYVLAKIFIQSEGLNSINITIPQDAYNIIVTDENNLPLNYTFSNGRIEVICPETRVVKIIFVTSSFTKKEGNIWLFYLPNLYYNVSVIVPSDTVILSTNPLPLKVTMSDSNIVLYFAKTPLRIEYTLLPPKSNIPKNNTHTNVNNTSTNTANVNKTNTNQSNNLNKNTGENIFAKYSALIYSVIGIVVIFILVFFLYKLYHREKRAMLTEEEKEIIEFVKSRRNRAYLTEIVEGLGLPKTTVWRKIKKLEKMGYLKTEKKREGLLVYIS